MMRPYELVDKVCAYDPRADEALLHRAYRYATRAHGSQKRASGDPYFSHPLEVAGILAALKLDAATIATGLLHDTIEDTGATYEELRVSFGGEVARLVDGVTKLSRLDMSSEETRQAENFRKLLMATADDVRVLLVKLADRLHNMRTLSFLSDGEKRRRIAQETMEIYAPLAGRIGMQEMREELEDLAFRYLNPEARETLTRRLDKTRQTKLMVLKRIEKSLRQKFSERNLSATVTSRAKRPYAIWRKMENRQIALEQLSDLIGFRAIMRSVEDCYSALGIVHTTWKTVPGRFKDYISTPKRNGYRSLHTTVVGPEQQRIELQIRTEEMHEIAEHGIAAHWSYKEGGCHFGGEPLAEPFAWIRRVVGMLEHGDTPQEFLEHTKLEMFSDQVFCFTVKGDLIVLPRGSTPIDFAYAVHTEIGDSCVGAKINGRPRPLRERLGTGDEVEILRSDAQEPSAAWESMAVTGKARSAIRRAVRQKKKASEIRLGRDILWNKFRAAGRRIGDKILERALGVLEKNSLEEIFLQVGRGEMGWEAVLKAVYPRAAEKARRRPVLRDKSAVPILGAASGTAIQFAPDSFPLPGERIVGIQTSGRGLVVYPIDSAALGAFDGEPDRWVDLAWETDASPRRFYPSRIALQLSHEVGSLAMVTALIADYDCNIIALQLLHRDPDCFTLHLDIEVHDLKHLNRLLSALEGLSVVLEARRERR